jgi:hypothetical protein
MQANAKTPALSEEQNGAIGKQGAIRVIAGNGRIQRKEQTQENRRTKRGKREIQDRRRLE